MKLRYSPTSPYVRKVDICAMELGIADQIEHVDTDPWDPATDLVVDNPLGRVPALLMDDGDILYDSGVICQYLDTRSDAAELVPNDARRWRVLRQHEMMNGVLDASVNALIERAKRPSELFWSDWVTFQLGAVRRALGVLAGEIDDLAAEPINLAQITAGVALGYLDFRFGDDIDWRSDHPALADWYAEFSQRESMLATVPKAPS